MTVIRSNEYAEAVQRVQASALFYHMVFKTKAVQGKRIIDLTRAEMLSQEVMHPSGGATHAFMMAANAQFAKLEKDNPQYAVPGFRALGTVPEAILSTWASIRESLTKYFGLSDDDIDNRLASGENISEMMNTELDKRNTRKEADNAK
jgi:hypothetical protein